MYAKMQNRFVRLQKPNQCNDDDSNNSINILALKDAILDFNSKVITPQTDSNKYTHKAPRQNQNLEKHFVARQCKGQQSSATSFDRTRTAFIFCFNEFKPFILSTIETMQCLNAF